TVNEEYSKLFGGRPNPPARVTIACGESLPAGANVIVSVVVALAPDATRQHLHVQSMSYWAPANIGPYSQATSVPVGNHDASALIYVAGQIPLVPASMEIVSRARRSEEPNTMRHLAAFRLQTSLALQHLWRIGKAMNACWWVGAIAFVVAGEDDIRERANIAASAWKTIHALKDCDRLTGAEITTDDADFDVWHQQRINRESFVTVHEDDTLPDFSCLSIVSGDGMEVSADRRVVPPFFAVEVAQLPRDSQVEWQALGVSRASVRFCDTVREQDNTIMACSIASDEKVFGFVGIKALETESKMYTQIEQAIHVLQERCTIPNPLTGHKTIYTSQRLDIDKMSAQIIPCRSVWDVQGRALAAAILVEYEIP
ncbi:MAG: hypothetical protein Q9223_006721, partial [Gallowayella weberi]